MNRLTFLFALSLCLMACLLACGSSRSGAAESLTNTASTNVDAVNAANQEHLVHQYDNVFVVYGVKNKAFALIQFEEVPEFPKAVTLVAPTSTTIQLRDPMGKNYFYSTVPEHKSHHRVLGTATFMGETANQVFLREVDGRLALNPSATISESPCLCRSLGDQFPCDTGGEGAIQAGTSDSMSGIPSFCDVRCGEKLSACAN